jgi:hypothetical protein
VRSDADYERMRAAIGVLLWPSEYTDEEITGANEVVDSVRKSDGVLRIVDSDTSSPSEDYPMGRIERITFELEVCFDG